MTDVYGYPTHPAGFDQGYEGYDEQTAVAESYAYAAGGQPPEEPWQGEPHKSHYDDYGELFICTVCGQPIRPDQRYQLVGHGGIIDPGLCGHRAHSDCEALDTTCTCGQRITAAEAIMQ
jgi:hypothetical protein